MTNATEETSRLSALCRTVVKDGRELDIVIRDEGDVIDEYDEGDEPHGRWSLQIVLDATTTTHWTDFFDTEQEALDEALRAIEEEDLGEFEMPPWPGPTH